MRAGEVYKCACCGEDKPDDGRAVMDGLLGGPVDPECHYRLCMAAKWMARGYKWKPEHGDEAKQYEGPCATRPFSTNTDITQFNINRFKEFGLR